MIKNVVLLTALAAGSVLVLGQNQSVLDLLRSLQPETPAAAQPQSPATSPNVSDSKSNPAGPPPALDTKPAFMSVLTNATRITNIVIVTNYVVVTNFTYTTNYYNAQGQLLMPVAGGAAPALAVASDAKSKGADPAVVRANQVQAVRDLLRLSVAGLSNVLSPEGSFTRNEKNQIRMPEGATIFDRKKAQTLSTAMNVAAEKAAPGACAILQKLAASLNPPEPLQVLNGGEDAATRLLISSEGQNAMSQIQGVVQSAATEARVPQAYDAAMLRGGGLLGTVLGTSQSVDMNAHITRGLMEAIVLNLAAQESQIRADPSRRTKAMRDAMVK